jgi:hypothetical protein
MQNRRQFIGATALASIPVALAVNTDLVSGQEAQAPDMTARMLMQVAAENARAYNDAKRRGPRGEHFRLAAGNLRMLAALNLDDTIRRSVRQHGRMHGHDPSAMHHADLGRMHRELRKIGMAIDSAEFERVFRTLEPKRQHIEEVQRTGFSVTAHLRTLSTLLESTGVDVARLEGPDGTRRVIRQEECDKYAYELNLLAYLTVILCAIGNVPGCLAAETSLILIQVTLYYAGC